MEHSIPTYMKKTYLNPLPIVNRGTLEDSMTTVNGDPFVMKYNGEYYCYSSGLMGVNLLHSTDLVQFEHMGFCFQEEGAFDYWAPCVIYDNGHFYMYYSTNPLGEYDNHAHCLKLAVSDSPFGPFHYVKQFFNNFSIDPHVIKNAIGEFYIFYSVNNYSGTDRNLAGTVIVADKLLDFEHFSGHSFPVIVPSIQEEIFAVNRFEDGRDWHTIEGAFYLEKGDNAYVMYSANCFVNPTYFVGYARSSKQVRLEDCIWNKYPDDYTYEPFVHQSKEVGGTGHNSVVKAPNNVDDWIVYHGHEQVEGGTDLVEHRAMRIDPILWGIDKMYTPAPSNTLQDAPAEPLYRNLYHEKRGKEIFDKGEWNIRDNCLCQDSSSAITSMYLSDISLTNYIYETNVRWKKHHFGGRYGIFAAYINTSNNVQVILNEGERYIEICAVIQGSCSETKKVSVNETFDFEAFHKLTVKRTGIFFQVYVDDVFMVDAVFPIGESSVGIINYYTAAIYDSVELTEYFELNSFNEIGFMQQIIVNQQSLEKNWVIIKGKLINYAVDSQELLFRPFLHMYRFSVNMKQIYRKDDTYCGIYAAYIDEENYIKVKLYQNSEKVKIETTKEGIQNSQFVIVEEKEQTTLYVKRIEGHIAILLGRQVISEQILDIQKPLRCGLCSNVRTIFSEIELLRL